MNHKYSRALETLGIRHGRREEGVTEKIIRQAYATRIKSDARPDTNPEMFNAVRDAYNTALAEIRQLQAKKHATQSIDIDNIGDQSFKNTHDSQPSTPDIQREEPSNTPPGKAISSFNDLQPGHDESYRNKKPADSEHRETEPGQHELTGGDSTQSTLSDKENHKLAKENPNPSKPSNKASEASETKFNQTENSQQNNNVWQTSDEDEQAVQRYFSTMAQLLDQKKNKDLGIEVELLKLCDLIFKHNSSVSVIKELRNTEQLAALVSAHDAAPLSLVKKLVNELELEGMAALSSTPESYTRLQCKYTDMLEVKAFEVRADGYSDFERHFIHGGKPPTRIGGFPTAQDKKRYSHTASWLLTCKPPRPDLIHPDSELIAKGKYVSPDNTKPEPVAVSRNFRMISRALVLIGLLAFLLFFIVEKFDKTDPLEQEILEDSQNPNSEVSTRVEDIRRQEYIREHPSFINLHALTFEERAIMEFAVEEEKLQQSNDDMSNSEFKKLVIEKPRHLSVVKQLLDDGVLQHYRLGTSILAKLEETSRIKKQMIIMPDGTAIQLRKGHYYISE